MDLDGVNSLQDNYRKFEEFCRYIVNPLTLAQFIKEQQVYSFDQINGTFRLFESPIQSKRVPLLPPKDKNNSHCLPLRLSVSHNPINNVLLSQSHRFLNSSYERDSSVENNRASSLFNDHRKIPLSPQTNTERFGS